MHTADFFTNLSHFVKLGALLADIPPIPGWLWAMIAPSDVLGNGISRTACGAGSRTSQPCPLDRTLAFLDPLLRRAALVVKGDDALSWPRQVGHDEADARVKLTRMPLDLRYDTARLFLALRLIGEAGVVPAHLVRRSPDWTLEQVSDLVL